MKRVFIKTFGCQMNVRDSEVIVGLLRKAGYRIVDEPDKADIVILNTCSVRQHAEDKVWSEVGRFKSRSTRAQGHKTQVMIGIVGCMAQTYKEAIFERAPGVDFVVGPSDIQKIPGIIKKLSQVTCLPAGRQEHKSQGNLFEQKIWETEGEARPEEIYHTGFYEDKRHTYVVISEGCSNFCSYCVVPYARGPLKNRDYKDILKEIKEAIAQGIDRITLLGQNVNSYKTQVSFIELLKLINKIRGLKEFGFITSHPKDTSVELFKAMAECNKLKKYLHLPIQSGSDRILKLMNRNYSRKFYLDLADNYRKIVKDGALTTDIIVGFPSETEADFQDTYDLVKKVKFSSGFIFKYSPRPHTEAAKFSDDVPKEEKERRHSLILELQKKISKGKRC